MSKFSQVMTTLVGSVLMITAGALALQTYDRYHDVRCLTSQQPELLRPTLSGRPRSRCYLHHRGNSPGSGLLSFPEKNESIYCVNKTFKY